MRIGGGRGGTGRIKAMAELGRIPIIALAAHAMYSDEERARAAGGGDLMTRPLDDDLLFEELGHDLDG